MTLEKAHDCSHERARDSESEQDVSHGGLVCAQRCVEDRPVDTGHAEQPELELDGGEERRDGGRCHGVDRKSTRLNSSHGSISYAVFSLKKKKHHTTLRFPTATKNSFMYIILLL